MLALTPFFYPADNDSVPEGEAEMTTEDEAGSQGAEQGVPVAGSEVLVTDTSRDDTVAPDGEADAEPQWPVQLPSTSYHYLPNGEFVEVGNDESRSSGSNSQPLSREQTMMVPKMEIVVLGVNEENTKIEGAVLDDHNNSYNKLKEFVYPYIEDDGYAKTAAGDMDGDDLDEIVIAIEHNESLDFIVLDDAEHNFTQLANRTSIDGEIEIEDSMLELAGGDIDGDWIDEIVITACEDEEMSYLWIYDDANNDFQELDFKFYYGKEPDVVLGDIDGDLSKEITWARVYNYTKHDDKDITLVLYKYIPTFLFSLDSNYTEHLQNESVNDELIKAFKENNCPLSNIAIENFEKPKPIREN